MKKIIMLSMFVFMVSACSSSSDSTTPGGTGGGSTGGGAALDTPVSGKVVHSAFSASDKVCYDRNGNKQCDTEEPFVLVSADGTYTIKGTVVDSAAVPLIAELGGASAPASLYDVSALRALGAPALVFETPAGQRTISSITTIIKSAMDNNPLLSLNDAEDEVKIKLGGVNMSLFDSSLDILTLANKISAAIERMFNKLAADFNITISKKAILLVMDEILPQLSSIANGTKTPEQVANDTLETKDKNTIDQEMEALANKVPSVKTAQDAFKDGLQTYDFRYEGSSYLFKLYDISNSAMSAFKDGNYQSALPTTLSPNTNKQSATLNNDGSVTFIDEVFMSFKVSTVETIQLGGKSLDSNLRHNNRKIIFPDGAILYKLNAISAAPIIDVDALRASDCTFNTGFACGTATVNNNTIEIRGTDDSYDIVMKSDGTYNIKVNTKASNYYENMVFSPALTPPSGKYTKSTDSYGDVYSFKNIDGVVVFKVFKSKYQDYFISGKFNDLLSSTTLMFNKIAAESIQSQW